MKRLSAVILISLVVTACGFADGLIVPDGQPTEAPAPVTVAPAVTQQPVRVVTATPHPPTPTPLPTDWGAFCPDGASQLSAGNAELIARLLWYETRGMAGAAKREAGLGIVGVVIDRTSTQHLSDGTVHGTLSHGSGPDEVWQFPAPVTNGCAEHSTESCVEEWSQIDLSEYYALICDYAGGDRAAFRALYYDSIGVPHTDDSCDRVSGACPARRHTYVVQDVNGEWIGFHNQALASKPPAHVCKWEFPDVPSFVVGVPMICPAYTCDPFAVPSKGHVAIDILAPERNPVTAAADGFVEVVDFNTSYGYHVALSHLAPNGVVWSTWYAHLAQRPYDLAPGDAVTAGELIGVIGNTGKSTGPHLHFEVRWHGDGSPVAGKSGVNVNPLPSLCEA
jgi:hypothetical protein